MPNADDEAVEFAHRMFDLARAGDAQLLAYVDAGVPVELTDAAGNSLLMLAAYHEHEPLVRGLSQRGADVDHLNDRWQSPLAGAVFKGRSTSSRCCSMPAPTQPWERRPRSRRPASSVMTRWRRGSPAERHTSTATRVLWMSSTE